MTDDGGLSDVIDEVLEATVVLSFTNLGYAARRRLHDWSDPGRLDGRTALVTGASSGLGAATTRALAERGARVWMLVRDEDKGARVRDEVAAASGNDDLSLVLADLADLASVRDAAAELRANLDRLDVVVHNAGALFDTRRESHDGIELTFQIHVVAPFLLTAELLEPLATARGRIITVSSGGLYTQPLQIDDLQSTHGYRGTTAYARAKRAQVLLTEEWAERLAPLGITAHAMHPGWADTPGVSGSLPGFAKVTGPFLRTAEEGADTIVWLAAAPEGADSTGRFWLDRRPRPTHKVPWTRSGDVHRRELWDAVADLAGVPADRLPAPTGP
jgi:NAD(P)-dependent dehydrogenase (short-subunit alcohol dehydrogenase family)